MPNVRDINKVHEVVFEASAPQRRPGSRRAFCKRQKPSASDMVQGSVEVWCRRSQRRTNTHGEGSIGATWNGRPGTVRKP